MEDGPKGELYEELVQLCSYWHTVPARYEPEGVVKQGNYAQHTSGLTAIWKGVYDDEVVALKVLSLPEDGGNVVARRLHLPIGEETDPKSSQEVRVFYKPQVEGSCAVVLTDAVEVLQRSSFNEATQTRQHRPFLRGVNDNL